MAARQCTNDKNMGMGQWQPLLAKGPDPTFYNKYP